MTKKQYLFILLSKLSAERSYAEGLKLVVQEADISDNVVDGIYSILSQALHETTESHKKEVMKKSIEILQKIKENNYSEQEHIDEEFTKLLDTI